ncbi:MAG TPA: acyltransferase [Patescibacteria group bacterium]|nr:acyltransferase [Patescibacteria group bacterium]
MSRRIHPTAIVEAGATIGNGTAVWDNAHIRSGATVGCDCIVGEKSYLAPGAVVGDRVKINAFVYVCTAVTIADGVMISAGVIFTNDRFPRATTPDLQQMRTSDPDEHTRNTYVGDGATIGAGAVIGCDLTIGRFAMVGMGAVVTRSVGDFCLVLGNPARLAGAVCRCGQLVARFSAIPPDGISFACPECERSYTVALGRVLDGAGANATEERCVPTR